MSSAANSAGNSRWQVAGRIAILGCSLVLALGVYFGLMGGWMQVFAGWTARSTGIVLNLMGFGASVDGTILRTSDFAANIVTECTAVGPLIVFLGAIVAYPATLRAKTIGAILGIVVLMGVNLDRIVSLFWIGTSPQYLDLAHLLVWQTAIIVLAIVLWLFWAERFARARTA